MTVRCELCGCSFGQITWTHLFYSHSGMSQLEYEVKFPTAPLRDFTEEHIHNLSVNKQEYWDSLTVEEWIDWFYKWSDLRLGVPASPEVCSNLRRASIENWKNSDFREKMFRTHFLATRPLGTGERISKAKKLYFATYPEEAEEAFQTMNRHHSIPSTEAYLIDLLGLRFPREWLHNKDSRIKIGNRHPDFISTSKKLVLESCSPRYHSQDPGDYTSEERIIEDFKKAGYICVVVWASDYLDIAIEWPELVERLVKAGEVADDL
jgi:hypothetical protein